MRGKILLALLLGLFLAIYTPPIAHAQTHDMWLAARTDATLSDITSPDGTLYDIYITDTREIVLFIDLATVSSAGIDTGSIYVAISPGLPKAAYLTLTTISANVNETYTDPSVINTTLVEYITVTSYPSTQMAVMQIKFKSLHDVALEYIDSIPGPSGSVVEVTDLYNTKLSIVIEDITPDRAETDNRFIVYEIPSLTLTPDMTIVNGDVVRYGGSAQVTINLTSVFNEINNGLQSTGIIDVIGAVDLQRPELEINVTMYNKENTAESILLANGSAGVLTVDPAPYFAAGSASVGQYIITFNLSNLQDFQPQAIDPAYSYITASYGFGVSMKFEYNVWNATHAIYFAFTYDTDSDRASGTNKYLRVEASGEVTAQDPTVAGDGRLNPGDTITVTLHNIPLGVSVTGAELIRGSYSKPAAVAVTSQQSGVITAHIMIPEGEWGGEPAIVKILAGSYYVDEKPDYTKIEVTIYPYIETYVITNATAYNTYNTSLLAKFTAGRTAAPGDYVMIKGYGFIQGEPVIYLNDTAIQVLDYKYLGDGEIVVLGKLITNNTAVATGAYTLKLVLGSEPNAGEIPFTVSISSTLEKIFISPEILYNETADEYVIIHHKLSEYIPFLLTYRLEGVDPYDEFYAPEFQLPISIEVIGYNATNVSVIFHNINYDVNFTWKTFTLDNGYLFWNMENETINMFLPYGNYTILVDIDTAPGLDGSRVFEVHVQADIDPVSLERGGVVNITLIGLPPAWAGNVSLTYTVYANGTNYYEVYGDIDQIYWEGTIVVQVNSNTYGVAKISLDTIALYPASYIGNATRAVAEKEGWIGYNVSKLLLFEIDYHLLSVSDTGATYQVNSAGSETDYTVTFRAYVEYNAEQYKHVTKLVSRSNATIVVTPMALPGDTIVATVYIHRTGTLDLYVDPMNLLEVPDVAWGNDIIWELWVRLVDTATGEVVYEAYYNSTIAPDILVIEDVDNDGVAEVYWRIPIDTSILGLVSEDKTYRVDVRLTWITSTSLQDLGTTVTDNGSEVYVDLRGRWDIGFADTLWWLGGSDQQVVVLGGLDYRLQAIYNRTVVLEALINGTKKLIEVDVMQLLKAINGSVVEIKDDVVYLKTEVGTIKTDLSTLLDLAKETNSTVTLVYGDLATLRLLVENSTDTILLRISDVEGGISDLRAFLNTTLPEILAKADHLELVVNGTKTAILAEIDDTRKAVLEVNASVEDVLGALVDVADEVKSINATANEIILLVGGVEKTVKVAEENITSILSTMRIQLDTVQVACTAGMTKVLEEINKTRDDILEAMSTDHDELKGFLAKLVDELEANITNMNVALESMASQVSSISTTVSSIDTNAKETNYAVNDMRSRLNSMLLADISLTVIALILLAGIIVKRK